MWRADDQAVHVLMFRGDLAVREESSSIGLACALSVLPWYLGEWFC